MGLRLLVEGWLGRVIGLTLGEWALVSLAGLGDLECLAGLGALVLVLKLDFNIGVVGVVVIEVCFLLPLL